MKTIYTEIADMLFNTVYDWMKYEEEVDTNEDVEVEVGGEVYMVPCHIKGENKSWLVNSATYDHPDEYEDRLWLSIEVDGDVSFEDESGDIQYFPGRALNAVVIEEGYDYYEE